MNHAFETPEYKAQADVFRDKGYFHIRRLPDGTWCGLAQLMYTTGLVYGLTEHSYSKRWCYTKREEAVIALDTWDGIGKPPGPWVAERGVEE